MSSEALNGDLIRLNGSSTDRFPDLATDRSTDHSTDRSMSPAMHSHVTSTSSVKSGIEREGSVRSMGGKKAQFTSFPSTDRSDSFDHDDVFQHDSSQSHVGSPAFMGPRSRSEGKLHYLDKPNHSIEVKLSKRESLKKKQRMSAEVQKKHYRKEKKRAAKELLCTLKDPSVIVLADWLKIRGTLKSWTKLWCVLKPGLLVLYKSQKAKSSHWVGTILLNTCELIERPSKKDGFCFKLFHPLDQSIWTTKGPKGENIGAITQPLPYSYLIFRAMSEAAGKCWMDALELALRCSSLLIRTMTKDKDQTLPADDGDDNEFITSSFNLEKQDTMNESDVERHFRDVTGEDFKTDREETKSDKSDSESDASEEEDQVYDENYQPVETAYIENQCEELGQQGESSQTEEVADENKSLIWSLVKQVRPGMDLSKVVLPTFILEPRSFLDKLSDYYYHADFLSEAVNHENPYQRMLSVVKWYLSGFYKKPKGLKKPYNPILGETFRCYWKHPKSGTRTFYVSEQVSHHPPVTAFHITNRQDGFNINGSILAKSKFYGNSLSAILDGAGNLSFLKRGEEYMITMPYAHCKGILVGTLTMEYGGKVAVECEKTGYRTELEFKLKPFLGTGEASNKLSGKVKLGSETLASLDGHWDAEVHIKEKTTSETRLFWNPTPEVKDQRLKRFTVPLLEQGEFESERLWSRVSAAIAKQDQEEATQEKYILEEAQRNATRERKATMREWEQKLFERDMVTGDWIYKFADSRPWDPMNDVIQYESDYVIQTKTRHKTPIIRANSILSVEQGDLRNGPVLKHGGTGQLKKSQSIERARVVVRIKQNKRLINGHNSGSSTPELGSRLSDSTESGDDRMASSTMACIEKALVPLHDLHTKNNERLNALQGQLHSLQRHQAALLESLQGLQARDFLLLGIILVLQTVLAWIFK